MRHSLFLKSVFIWYDQTHLLKDGFNGSEWKIDIFLDSPPLLWREKYEMLLILNLSCNGKVAQTLKLGIRACDRFYVLLNDVEWDRRVLKVLVKETRLLSEGNNEILLN